MALSKNDAISFVAYGYIKFAQVNRTLQIFLDVALYAVGLDGIGPNIGVVYQLYLPESGWLSYAVHDEVWICPRRSLNVLTVAVEIVSRVGYPTKLQDSTGRMRSSLVAWHQ